ncbi:MAG: hypothetical protein RLZZ621_576 [Gemmatimonadota bacterium]
MSPLLWTTLSVAAAALALMLVGFAWLNRQRLETDRQVAERMQQIAASAGAPTAGVDAMPVLRTASGTGWRSLWQTALSFVSLRQRRHQRRVEAQFPDALDMLVNALRAGYAVPTAMEFIGHEMPAPVGPIFQRCHDEQRLGVDPRTALANLQDRLGTIDAQMFVLALLIQRETGGNLAEILGNIAQIIRERVEFRNQVEVLTAESRLSATVLTVLPLLLFVVIRVLNPSYLNSLIETRAGLQMILYAVVSLGMGTIVLRRMASIEV